MAFDRRAFEADLKAHAPALAEALLGRPSLRGGAEWRWGRRGSLAVVVAGAKAGQWYDHERGEGGGFRDLVARELGLDPDAAREWIGDRIGYDLRGRRPAPRTPAKPPRRTAAPEPAVDDRAARAERGRSAAAAIWARATPAAADHPYLRRKGVGPHDLRCDGGSLIVPLRDLDGRLQTLEFIRADGGKRYLKGGAKRGGFCTIGGPLAADQPILICEGWATGASLQEATGAAVVAAMDAGNLGPVAEAIRSRFPDAEITLVADNDAEDGRRDNPGLAAARKAAQTIDGRLAVPPMPGDANDLAVARGLAAVAACVEAAEFVPAAPPTYPAPTHSVDEARAELDQALDAFMADVPAYWAAVDAADAKGPADPLDFNAGAPATPPLLGLPVDVGLGKTSAARAAIAELLAAGGLAGRKVVFAVPRHDLGAEQVAAFEALGVRAMLWKGRAAPDPTPEDPERRMCLDLEATLDALEVEQPVERSCCKVKRGGELHRCALFEACGYQAQKAAAQAAQVVVCAHDSLFHMKPEIIGKVGLLVIDEAFWQAGLRGLDGKALLTQDGLEPGKAWVTCYRGKGRVDVGATADLIAARGKLWKALQATEPGPLFHGLLASVGLTAEECRNAAALERRRMRDPGLTPGMSPSERRRRIEKVLPPRGRPWAPPGRCAALWHILAEALEDGHDAAGAVVANEITENGTVRAIRLRWRSQLRAGWGGQAPVLHLDATLREALVRPYLPRLALHAPVCARLPHVRVRQVLDSPTAAKALTPAAQAPDRDHAAARRRLRELQTWIALRARENRRPGRSVDVLVVGQKAAIDVLRGLGLPPRVEAVHFNGLSGLDRWGGVGALIVLGRTLPAPGTVEALAAALTGRAPQPNPEEAGWWYPLAERRFRLADGRSHAVPGETHADAVAEAIRWTICEGELIQAMGRGRGVNRTPETRLEIDLLTDVVLPVAVHELVRWPDLRPNRRDLMAAQGVVLENAADMAVCFPELWPSRDAARQDRSRSVTNCYYRSFYNSETSHSSVVATYRPEGAGKKPRQARFDLSLIRDPEVWLANRLGPLAAFELRHVECTGTDASEPTDAGRLDVLASRLTASMRSGLETRRAALDALAAWLEAAKPAAPQRSSQLQATREIQA
ncbi:MAG: toprim domain-containing protein [Pseudomonadota bacterium]